MSKRQKLVNSVIHILDHNRDGSYRTRHDRQQSLLKIINDLYAAGYQLEHVRFMKPKHIWHVVKSWENKISVGAIKNRLSHLRWLLGKLNKSNVVPSNKRLGIPNRCYSNSSNKSRELTQADLIKIRDPLMQLSLQAQQLFGLRVEESLKIKPFIADQGEKLFIQSSWAKGGRNRFIPIESSAQKQWVMDAKKLVDNKNASLIPSDTRYKTYRSRFAKACQRAGIVHCHGHRHHYAQQRYQQLTGWTCPAKGGVLTSQLTESQKIRDHEARLEISRSLGHSRESITRVYLN